MGHGIKGPGLTVSGLDSVRDFGFVVGFGFGVLRRRVLRFVRPY